MSKTMILIMIEEFKKFIKSFIHRVKINKIAYFNTEEITTHVITTRHKLCWCTIVILSILSLSAIQHHKGYIAGYYQARYNIIHDIDTIIAEMPLNVILTYDDPFSEEKMVDMLIHLNVKNIPIVVAQARLESGSYKSTIFKDNNNMFGMKCAYSRIHTHDGEQHNHAKYDTWRDCVLDYAFYQASYLKDAKSESDYLKCLDASYAEIGGKYSAALKPIIEQVKQDYNLK